MLSMSMGSPAGMPSRMTTSARPCDSPAVRNRTMRTLIVYEETAALPAAAARKSLVLDRARSSPEGVGLGAPASDGVRRSGGRVRRRCSSRTAIFAAPAAGSIWRLRAPCASPCATPARSGIRSSGLNAARCSRSCATRCSIRSSISAWPGRRCSSRSTHHADGWQRLRCGPDRYYARHAVSRRARDPGAGPMAPYLLRQVGRSAHGW